MITTFTSTAGNMDAWGFILEFLDEDDPRPAREQFHERYIGGWLPAPPALDFDPYTGVMTYPGDPPFRAIAAVVFRNEIIALFPGSFVVIIQADMTWAAARMD